MTAQPMIAAFPMYTRPELQPAFDALWAHLRDGLRARGIDAPDQPSIVDGDHVAFWQRRELLISQTCGFPFRHFLLDHVTLVGTPDFGLPGCARGYYRSALVVRHDDPRDSLTDFHGAVIACNDRHSQSGYAAPLVAAQQAGVRFDAMRISGSHSASAKMVAEGGADIAGLDAVSWRHMGMFDARASSLRVLDWTAPTPGLPFVTAAPHLAVPLRDCLSHAIESMPDNLKTLLTLQGIVQIDRQHYCAVPSPLTDTAPPQKAF